MQKKPHITNTFWNGDAFPFWLSLEKRQLYMQYKYYYWNSSADRITATSAVDNCPLSSH